LALLAGYSGIVHCDGYQVYEQLVGPKFTSGEISLVFLLVALAPTVLSIEVVNSRCRERPVF
jgi:hypothetical protein